MIPAARHACRPAQLALACPCPEGHLLSTQHSAAPGQGWEDYLPVLNTVPLPLTSRLSGLIAYLSSTEIIEASPPSTASVPPPRPPPTPIQWQRHPPLGSFCQCPTSLQPMPWTLSGHSSAFLSVQPPSFPDSSYQHLKKFKSLTPLKTYLIGPKLWYSLTVLSPPFILGVSS